MEPFALFVILQRHFRSFLGFKSGKIGLIYEKLLLWPTSPMKISLGTIPGKQIGGKWLHHSFFTSCTTASWFFVRGNMSTTQARRIR